MPRILWFLLLGFLPVSLWSQADLSWPTHADTSTIQVLHLTPDSPDHQKGKYSLSDYLYILIDSTGELTFSESASAGYADSYIPVSNVSLRDLAINHQKYWLRLTIQSSLPEEETWLTNIFEAEVTAFTISDEGEIVRKHSGYLVDVEDRYFNERYGFVATLPIQVPAVGIQNFYWEVKPGIVNGQIPYDLHLDLALLSDAYLSNYLVLEGIILALFLGFYLAVRNISFVYFIYEKRKRILLWFSLYCLASILSGIFLFGYDLPFLITGLSYPVYYFLKTVALLLWLLTFLLLSRSFLQIRTSIRGWDQLIWILFGTCIPFLIAGNILQWQSPEIGLNLYRAGHILLILLALVLIIGAIRCLQNGMRIARHYLLASLVFLIGSGLSFLTDHQYLPAIRHIHWIIIGAWIQLRIFAIGIGLAIPEQNRQRQIAIDESGKLKQLNQLITRLYTNITHEFRTPLTVILGMTDSIKGFDSEKEIITRNGKKLLGLTNKLLDLSKLDAGAAKASYQQSDIIYYLNYLVESFYSIAKEKGIHLSFFSEEDEIYMDFDEDKIQHLIYNLLSNGIKFTKPGGKVSLIAKKVDAKANSQLQITYKDTGIGIAEDQIPFIFDRFYQGEGAHIRQGEGTGIGLALVKEIVLLLGGEITVKSALGKGTRFTLLLPLTNNAPIIDSGDLYNDFLEAENVFELADQEQQSERSPLRTGPLAQNNPLLLIVEDNMDVVGYLQTIAGKNFQIETASNGKEGLEKALEIIPDIIITDVIMPEMDGITLTNTLKQDERTSHIPVILLTAKAGQEDRIAGLRVGADAFLTKPFNKQELLIRLNKLDKQKNAIRQYYSNLDPLNIKPDSNAKPEYAFLKKASEVVQENLSDSTFSVVQFCRKMKVSQPQLYRKLTALTGQSPSMFIKTLRLHKAVELLKNTDYNISEIAWKVGFNDPGYFSRAFQKEFGQSPSEFRR